MSKAVGLIEIRGLPSALLVVDTVAKSADVRLREMEFTNGYGEVAIKFDGTNAAVRTSFEAGVRLGKKLGALYACCVIGSPEPETLDLIDTEPVINPILEGYESLSRGVQTEKAEKQEDKKA